MFRYLGENDLRRNGYELLERNLFASLQRRKKDGGEEDHSQGKTIASFCIRLLLEIHSVKSPLII